MGTERMSCFLLKLERYSKHSYLLRSTRLKGLNFGFSQYRALNKGSIDRNIVFLFLHENIFYGDLLEMPQQGTSNGCPVQSCASNEYSNCTFVYFHGEIRKRSVLSNKKCLIKSSCKTLGNVYFLVRLFFA